MTNFENAFYGLDKKDSYELNTIINNVAELDGDLSSYVTTTALTTTLGSYETTANLATTLKSYAKIVTAPASATATGTAGQIAYDATHIYVCVATNTWVRATLATW